LTAIGYVQDSSVEMSGGGEQQGPHPIFDLIAEAAEDGDREPTTFNLDKLKAVTECVDGLLESSELFEAVECVLLVAHALEVERESKRAARTLLDIIERPQVLKAMKSLNRIKDGDRAEGVAASSKAFHKFAQTEGTQTVLPEAKDEEPPEGAVKLGNLNFPKRL
jgi:hypothetical protein